MMGDVDRPERQNAGDLLRRVLDAVEHGELADDGRTAVAVAPVDRSADTASLNATDAHVD